MLLFLLSEFILIYKFIYEKNIVYSFYFRLIPGFFAG